MVILIEPCSYFVKFFFQLSLTKEDSEITMTVLSHIFDLMLHHEKKEQCKTWAPSINIPERHYPYTYRVKSFTFSSDSSPESFPPLSWKCSATSFGLSFVIVCRKQPPKKSINGKINTTKKFYSYTFYSRVDQYLHRLFLESSLSQDHLATNEAEERI